jgi:hypothetical protein
MYKVTATMINAFTVDATAKYPESFKMQLLGDNYMKDGQIKKEMVTLNVPEDVYNSFLGQIGKRVTIPVSFFASGGQINHFYPKGVPFNSEKAASAAK